MISFLSIKRVDKLFKFYSFTKCHKHSFSLINFFTNFFRLFMIASFSDSVYVMCFSLILLSVDLTSPHVKNKMSKREFIRNTRNALLTQPRVSDDLYGEMYDNVFLRGHVSSSEGKSLNKPQQQFVPGYLALFL